MLRVVDVERVVIEGRQRADDADHDRHGVRVAPEAAEQEDELLMHHGVHGDVVFELTVLLLRRQFAEQQ